MPRAHLRSLEEEEQGEGGSGKGKGTAARAGRRLWPWDRQKTGLSRGYVHVEGAQENWLLKGCR